jgi:isopenicillin-N N-acyltransferase-like protein
MAPEPLTLRTIHVQGTPAELGRAHGEELRSEVRAFVAQRLAALRVYMEERGTHGGVEDFLRVGARCLEIARDWDPLGSAEHDGIAEGAGVDPAELYAVANMTDVRDVLLLPPPNREDEGCTSFLLPARLSAQRAIVAGQTWDLNPDDLDFVVAVHRRPTEGPETWSVTCVGCLSLVGMNEWGLAVGTTNIKVRSTRPGVGYMSLLHRALQERSRQAACDTVLGAPRAAAHTYWMADADGGLEIEAMAFDAVVRQLDNAPEALAGDGPLVRTNHCLAPSVAALQGEPTTSSSRARLKRAQELLGRGPHDLESLKALLADRSDGVDSINRYPEDEQGTTTNSCVLAWPAERLLWACRGPADRGAWVRLPFSFQ